MRHNHLPHLTTLVKQHIARTMAVLRAGRTSGQSLAPALHWRRLQKINQKKEKRPASAAYVSPKIDTILSQICLHLVHYRTTKAQVTELSATASRQAVCFMIPKMLPSPPPRRVTLIKHHIDPWLARPPSEMAALARTVSLTRTLNADKIRPLRILLRELRDARQRTPAKTAAGESVATQKSGNIGVDGKYRTSPNKNISIRSLAPTASPSQRYTDPADHIISIKSVPSNNSSTTSNNKSSISPPSLLHSSTLYLDGDALGRWVIGNFERALSKPLSGMTGVDPRATRPIGNVSPF